MRIALALLLLATSTASAQVSIGTYAPPTPPPFATATGPFGQNSVGQGFFAPAGATTLTSLSYFVTLGATFPGGGPSTLSIFRFDGTNLTSASLFSTAFTNPTTAGPSLLTFNSSLSVIGGARYIALFNTTVNSSTFEANIYETPNSAANTTNDVFYLCGVASATSCTVRDPGNVAAFRATFATAATTVPEPSTFVLFAAGLAGVVFARRRRNA